MIYRSSLKFLTLILLSLGVHQVAFSATFHPAGAEYSVEFPITPAIEEYQNLQDGKCRTVMGHIIKDAGRSGLKAEYILCENHDSQSVSKESLQKMLQKHAKSSGVSNAVYEYHETKLGKIGLYRGDLEQAGNMFIVVVFVGDRGGLTLTGSAPYKLATELGFDNFLKSVRRFK